MKSKKIFIFLLVLVFILAACKPIEYNDERDRAQVVAIVNGVAINKGVFNDKLDAIKPFFEQTITSNTKGEVDAEIVKQKEDILETLIDIEIKRQQIEKYNIKINNTDQSEIEAMYKNAIENMKDLLRLQYQSTGIDINEKGFDKEVEEMFIAQGTTKDEYIENCKQIKLFNKLDSAVKSELSKVSETEIYEYYNMMIAGQMKEYNDNPNKFESAMEKSEYVVYVPEGYRKIKRIFIKYSDIEYDMIIELRGYNKPDALEDTIDKAFSNISDRVNEVMSYIYSGEKSFNELMVEYSDDKKYELENLCDGYYVSQNTTKLDENMVAASMLLKNIGDISEPVKEELGASILLYYADVKPTGILPLEQSYTQIEQAVLENKREEYLEEKSIQWKEEADIVRYLDLL